MIAARERILIHLDAWILPETADQRQALADAAGALAQAGRITTLGETVTRTVRRGGGPVRVEPDGRPSVFPLLPPDEAAWVAETGADVIVPVPDPGTDVLGVLVVGRRVGPGAPAAARRAGRGAGVGYGDGDASSRGPDLRRRILAGPPVPGRRVPGWRHAGGPAAGWAIAPAEAVSLAARLAGALEALHLCVAARPGRGGVDPDGPPVAAAGDRARLRRSAGRGLRERLAKLFSSGLSGSLLPYVIR